MSENLINTQSAIDLLLFSGLFFCVSMLTFTFFRKTSIWYCVKAERLEIENLIHGAFVLFSSLMFTLALAWSGPLVFLIIVPGTVLLLLSILSIAYMPIVFGGLLSKYFFLTAKYNNSKNIFYATAYLFLISLLPSTISLTIFAIIFLYVYGISAKYIWLVLTKNYNVI